jgi:hypothetical protein
LGFQISPHSLHSRRQPRWVTSKRSTPRKSCRMSPRILFPYISFKPVSCSYSRQQLYGVVADVDSYNKFVPFCTRSKVLSQREPLQDLKLPDGFSMDAELTIGFLSFTESYVSKVTCSPYDSVKVSLCPHVTPPPSNNHPLSQGCRILLHTFVQVARNYLEV